MNQPLKNYPAESFCKKTKPCLSGSWTLSHNQLNKFIHCSCLLWGHSFSVQEFHFWIFGTLTTKDTVIVTGFRRYIQSTPLGDPPPSHDGCAILKVCPLGPQSSYVNTVDVKVFTNIIPMHTFKGLSQISVRYGICPNYSFTLNSLHPFCISPYYTSVRLNLFWFVLYSIPKFLGHIMWHIFSSKEFRLMNRTQAH